MMRSAVPEQSRIDRSHRYDSEDEAEASGVPHGYSMEHSTKVWHRRQRGFRIWSDASEETADIRVMVHVIAAFALAVAVSVMSLRAEPLRIITDAVLFVPAGLLLLVSSAKWFLPIFALLLLTVPRELRLGRLSRAIQVMFGCAVFMSLFVIAKSTLIFASPFRFDAALEHFDRVLHFGTRPLELTQTISAYINPHVASFFYMTLWPMPSFFLPLIILLIEPNWSRRRRFIMLYFFVFMGLGLVVAYLGMSAGPVYHDHLVSQARFADMASLQQQSGLALTGVPVLQNLLWDLYSRDLETASGISAFPSVHVAMATVVGLYIIDRWRWLAPVGIAIIVWYQFLSVYTGWHYAVDGYFSILAVWAFWYWLRRRDRRAAVDRSGEAA